MLIHDIVYEMKPLKIDQYNSCKGGQLCEMANLLVSYVMLLALELLDSIYVYIIKGKGRPFVLHVLRICLLYVQLHVSGSNILLFVHVITQATHSLHTVNNTSTLEQQGGKFHLHWTLHLFLKNAV